MIAAEWFTRPEVGDFRMSKRRTLIELSTLERPGGPHT